MCELDVVDENPVTRTYERIPDAPPICRVEAFRWFERYGAVGPVTRRTPGWAVCVDSVVNVPPSDPSECTLLAARVYMSIADGDWVVRSLDSGGRLMTMTHAQFLARYRVLRPERVLVDHEAFDAMYILHRIVWGEQHADVLIEQAIEELAELIVALTHYRRGRPDSMSVIHAEAIDVVVCLESLSRLFDWPAATFRSWLIADAKVLHAKLSTGRLGRRHR